MCTQTQLHPGDDPPEVPLTLLVPLIPAIRTSVHLFYAIMSSDCTTQVIQDWESFIREPVRQVDQFLRINNAQSDTLLHLSLIHI